MDAYYGLNSAKWSRVDNGQDEEAEGIIEPSGVVVVGTSQRERRIRITSSRSGDFHAAGGAACFLTAQSHHRYSQVVHRTLQLVTHLEPQMESLH